MLDDEFQGFKADAFPWVSRYFKGLQFRCLSALQDIETDRRFNCYGITSLAYRSKANVDSFCAVRVGNNVTECKIAARPIRQWRRHWPLCLERLLDRFCQKQGATKGIKEFISVLMLYKDHDAKDIEAAVEQALSAHVSSSQAVEHILKHPSDRYDSPFAPLTNWPTLPAADISIYGQIGGEL